jgi:hypothetical protein
MTIHPEDENEILHRKVSGSRFLKGDKEQILRDYRQDPRFEINYYIFR